LDLQEMNMIEKLTLPKNPSQKITITTLDCPKLPDDTIVNLPNTFTVNHSATK
jgi:hypothetical protein